MRGDCSGAPPTIPTGGRGVVTIAPRVSLDCISMSKRSGVVTSRGSGVVRDSTMPDRLVFASRCEPLSCAPLSPSNTESSPSSCCSTLRSTELDSDRFLRFADRVQEEVVLDRFIEAFLVLPRGTRQRTHSRGAVTHNHWSKLCRGSVLSPCASASVSPKHPGPKK